MKKGWLLERADSVLEDVIRPSICSGARSLVELDRDRGFRLVLVTGELDFALGPVVRYFGFDDLISNALVYENGTATGEVAAPLIAGDEKVAAMKRLCRLYNADTAESKAYSDSFSDAPMLEAVGNPIAVNPDSPPARPPPPPRWPG